MRIDRHISILLILIFISTFFIPTLSAQVPLPEGTKARLGNGRPYEVKYTPDGTQLAVATSIGIWMFDTITDKELALLTKHEAPVTHIVFSPDSSILASHDQWNNAVHFWETDTGEHKKTLEGHEHPVSSVVYSSDVKTFAFTLNTTRVFDVD